MKTRIFMGAMALAMMLAGRADAQTTFNGAEIFVRGANPPLNGGWDSVQAEYQLFDNGTNGDASAGDGIFTRDATITNPATRFEYKVASADWSTVNSPRSGGNLASTAAAGTVKFYFDSNPVGDGYLPDVGSVFEGLVYTDPSPITTSNVPRVTGNFISKLPEGMYGPAGNDWDPSEVRTTMNDDATSGDLVAADGIYTLVLTGLPAGTHYCKITFDGNWDFAVGNGGGYGRPDNISFDVLAPTDTITFEFKPALGGRYKISNDNPTLNPGPPFFAVSSAWNTERDAGTMLYDDGTNGDVVGDDGIYSRRFVTNGAGEFGVEVRQYLGPKYPGGGAYPIDIETTGQAVLVQFDTNERNDGYLPSTRYVWTDPDSRHDSEYVQAIGGFMAAFGGTTNFANNDPDFQLSDAGAAGDVAAGDRVFAKTFSGVAEVTNAELKFIGSFGSWDYQFGGEGEGFTRFGSNAAMFITTTGGSSVTFQVDAVTGRAGVGTTLPLMPATRSAIVTETSANDWQLFE